MEVSGISTGAAVYALKKALEMQGSAIDIIAPQQPSGDLLSVKTVSRHAGAENTSETTGKGGIIDIFA